MIQPFGFLRIHFFLIFILLGLTNLEAESITLDQAVKEALATNLGLQQEGIKTGIKKRDKDLSLNKLYPTLIAGAAVVHMNDMSASKVPITATAIPNTNMSEVNYYTPNANAFGVVVTTSWNLSWSTILSIKQTSIDYDNSKISYEVAKQNLSRDVKKLFYQLLVYKQQIDLTQRQLDNAEERYRQAKTNFSAGLAPELTVLQAQVTWENRKPAQDDMKINYAQMLFNFENLLGREPQEDLILVGSLDVQVPEKMPSADALINKYLDKRLDIQAVKGQVSAITNNKDIQDSLDFPSLSLSYGFDPAISDPWNSKTDWSKSSNWIQEYDSATGSGALTLSLMWKLDSLIPTSQTDMQKQDAQDQLNQARLNLGQAALTARTQIITLVKKLQKSINAFRSLEQNQEVAHKAYILTQEAYNTGARSLLEVQDSELQYQSAQLSFLNEKQVYNSTLLDLETALNAPQEEFYGISK